MKKLKKFYILKNLVNLSNNGRTKFNFRTWTYIFKYK